MAIEFQCPHCQGTLRLKDKFAGQRGSCRHCGGEIVTPSPAAADELEMTLLEDVPAPAPQPQAAKPVASVRPKPVPPRPASTASNGASGVGDLVRFRCDQCGASMKAPTSLAGRSVTCPSCRQRLRVPGAAAPRPTAELGARSSADAPSPAPVVRPAPRPSKPAAATSQKEEMELLPENDELELLPAQDEMVLASDNST
ncbi:MAG TPA: hypothetical protein VGJ26_02440, partial [Pirellulales bacterium]